MKRQRLQRGDNHFVKSQEISTKPGLEQPPVHKPSCNCKYKQQKFSYCFKTSLYQNDQKNPRILSGCWISYEIHQIIMTRFPVVALPARSIKLSRQTTRHLSNNSQKIPQPSLQMQILLHVSITTNHPGSPIPMTCY